MLLGLNEPSRQRHHFHLYSDHLHFVFDLRQNNAYRRSVFRRDEEDLFKIVLAPQNTPIDGVMAMLGYTRFQIGNGTKKQIVFRRFALVP